MKNDSGILRLRKRAWDFLSDEDGTASIEFAIMVPLVTGLILVVTDASLLFMRQSAMMNVARDTARAVARRMMNEAQATTYAEAAAKSGQSSPTATVVIKDGAVTVTLSVAAKTAAPFGVIAFAVDEQIIARTQNIMEPM